MEGPVPPTGRGAFPRVSLRPCARGDAIARSPRYGLKRLRGRDGICDAVLLALGSRASTTTVTTIHAARSSAVTAARRSARLDPRWAACERRADGAGGIGSPDTRATAFPIRAA